MDDAYRLQVDTPLESLDPEQWDELVGAHPTLSHAYFSALHDTGCAGPRTGWTPFFLTLQHAGKLAGAVPLYLKTHSRGEYVFDHAWADAYERHGMRYYPKLLAAVPFTPVPGPRLLATDDTARAMLARGLVELASGLKLSSLHVLFAPEKDIAALRQAGCLVREGVQFHWRNAGYADFESFLAGFNHDKRKKLRQDRKKAQAHGVHFQHIRGRDIGAAELDFFYACYERTYFEHGNSPYLTRGFFERLHARHADSLVLVLALCQKQPLACALNLCGADALYGRYWGTMQFMPGLHFETCYMQAIEYCIAEGLDRFEGGAQGEHKMARGLLPTPTQSAHWIADPRFAAAIDDFLGRETEAVNEYRDTLARHTPLRRDD
ncbi:GNAT family N-acetyltransferase [Bordetella holmesii]|uniref:GNAT family N-acetyltransferase n=1 Tax=Bordetella holmesii TaxID=35814 RepID=UPI0012986113|nr:GNAT family N-acetyltransferase [Bordetella holmesii]QGE28700.1 N-acetyltransferase [Bordetella holmesii]QGE39364.1 N-acetyltransferase [Bordetella holmesii]QGE42606.1 N-acetyltransferase [Bordetella holmesii]QGE45854.1 N-acetyltransferase [Bordetella holmesii]